MDLFDWVCLSVCTSCLMPPFLHHLLCSAQTYFEKSTVLSSLYRDRSMKERKKEASWTRREKKKEDIYQKMDSETSLSSSSDNCFSSLTQLLKRPQRRQERPYYSTVKDDWQTKDWKTPNWRSRWYERITKKATESSKCCQGNTRPKTWHFDEQSLISDRSFLKPKMAHLDIYRENMQRKMASRIQLSNLT